MDTIRALHRKPDLLKVLVAAGLATVGMTGTDLIIPVLAGRFWGETMAAKGSAIAAVRAAVQLLATPIFGRWCDSVPRKWGFMMMGVAIWLPLGPLLIFGESETALWGGAIARIASGICGSSAVGYALVNDLTTDEERPGVMAIGAAFMVLVQWAPRVVVAVVHKAFPSHLFATVYVDIGTLIVFCLFVAWIHMPGTDSSQGVVSKDASFGMVSTRSGGSVLNSDPSNQSLTDDTASDEESAGPDVQLPRSEVQDVVEKDKAGKTPAPFWFAIVETVRLLVERPALLIVCTIFALVSIPEVAESEVTPQLTFKAFGLFDQGDEGGSALPNRVDVSAQELTFLAQYTFLMSTCVLFVLLAFITKWLGLLTVVRLLVPITALAQMVPCAYFLLPASLQLLGAMNVIAPIAVLIGIPLHTLVTLVAPQARMTEALCAISLCKGFSALFGNLAVPPILKFVGADRLWVFYVGGALCTMSAVPMSCILRLPRNQGPSPRPSSP